MKQTDFEAVPNINAAHAGPLVVGAASALLSALVPLHAETRMVLIKVETASLRFTINGTTPTAALGFNLLADTTVYLSREEADNCKLIRATGADSAIQVAQYLR